jgi:hypothetical protein
MEVYDERCTMTVVENSCDSIPLRKTLLELRIRQKNKKIFNIWVNILDTLCIIQRLTGDFISWGEMTISFVSELFFLG